VSPPLDACGYDAAAYALGALDDGELTTFRAHLDGCAVCRDELAAFEHVATVLPLSVSRLTPPKRLRRRLLAELRADARAKAPVARLAHGTRRPALSGLLVRPAAALACAAVLAVGGVGAALTLAGSGPAARAHTYAAAVYAPTGRAQLQVRGGHLRLIVHDMPAPRAGHIYEVWLQRDAGGAPQPTRALFSVGAGGDAAVAVPGAIGHLHRVLVTQEPAGGRAVPTTSPVVVATL
jgi:hypothetical protein